MKRGSVGADVGAGQPEVGEGEGRRQGLKRLLGGALGAASLGLPPGLRPAWAQASGATPGASGAGTTAANAAWPIFVLNSLEASVSVIDPVRWVETTRLPTGKEPHHLYLTPDETSLLVGNAASNSITVLDPRTAQVQRTLVDIIDPYHLRFSPDMQWFVTAANRLDHVDIYRWNRGQPAQPFELKKRLSAPKTPSHISIDAGSRTAYITLQDSDELLAIDLATQAVVWKRAIGKMPADVYMAPDQRHLYVALTGERHVAVLDLAAPGGPALRPRIETDAGAHAFRAMGDGRHVFVSNRSANTISLLDTHTHSVVSRLPGPSGPDCMELMADRRHLLVTSRWAGKLSVIDITTRTVVRQVRVGRSPHGVWTLGHARGA